MAVDPDQIHDISIATVQLWRDAELRLTELIASFLREGIDAPTWATERLAALGDLRRAAEDVLGQLETEGLPLLRDNVAEAYRTGFGAALTDLPDPFLARAAQAATATIPRLAAMESLSAALIVDIGQRHNNVLRHVIDVYRATIAQASALSIAGGVTRRRASQDAYARFIDQGVSSFTDVAGRRWRLSSYVEMATRTVTQRAAVQGRTDRLQSIGVNLVVVSDSPRECKRCRPWESQVLSLDGTVGTVTLSSVTSGEPVTVEVEASLDQARATGLFHPNCTHSVSGYLPGATRVTPAQANPEGDQAQQRQREIERHIRGWKERGAGAIEPKAQAEAGKRQRAWEQEMREHLKANPELKRLPYREEVGAGNRPPPGLRGGGPSGSPLPTPPPGPSRQGPPARRGPDARTGPLARRGPSAQRGPDAQRGPGAMRTPPRAGAAASANMTVPELRALARERGIRGYSTMRKQELLDALGGPSPVRVPPPARKTPAKRAAPVKRPPAAKRPTPAKMATPKGVAGLPRVRGKVGTPQVVAKGTNPRYGSTAGSGHPTYRAAGQAGQRWTPSMGPLPSGAFEENCTNVVMAFEMRMRGYSVTAAPIDVLDRYGYGAGRTFAEVDDLVRSAWRLPNGKPHGRSFASQAWRSFAEIDREILETWPDGGRGFMTVGRHVFSVMKINGRVVYIEAQTADGSGVVTAAYKRKFKGSGSEEAKVIRLDDLEPSDGILEAVEAIP